MVRCDQIEGFTQYENDHAIMHGDIHFEWWERHHNNKSEI